MLKKIAAVVGGVFIGLIIAFARVGAFPFWGSDSTAPKAPPAQQAQAARAEPLPAPPVPGIHVAPPAQPNTPEAKEQVGVITSFAPLVKRMIPAVVSVNVVQDVKVSGMPFSIAPSAPGDDNGGDEENGGGGGGDQGGGGGMSPGDPFDQLRRYFGQGGQREY